MSDPSESHIILQACRALDAEADACGGSRRNWLRETASCARAEFLALFKRADESTRPADIVAARIEGLREGAKIARENISWTGGYEGESVVLDEEDIVPVIDARIAELEANAPEVSETRAKAEAFDAALTRFVANPGDVADWTAAQLRGFLHEAKRKGVGT